MGNDPCSCPFCKEYKIQAFKIIESIITKRKIKTFTKNNKFHYHNRGIHQEKLKCKRCGNLLIYRFKNTCQSCDYNKKFKPRIIIIKKGKIKDENSNKNKKI